MIDSAGSVGIEHATNSEDADATANGSDYLVRPSFEVGILLEPLRGDNGADETKGCEDDGHHAQADHSTGECENGKDVGGGAGNFGDSTSRWLAQGTTLRQSRHPFFRCVVACGIRLVL